jgi:hypothetical protein
VRVCPAFLKNKIDGDTLTDMDEFDMEILEINTEDRENVLFIINEAKQSLVKKKLDELEPPDDSYEINKMNPLYKGLSFRDVQSSLDEISKKYETEYRVSPPIYKDKPIKQGGKCKKSKSECRRSSIVHEDIACKKHRSDEIVSLTRDSSSPQLLRKLSFTKVQRRGSRSKIASPVFRIDICDGERVREWSVDDVTNFLKKNSMTKHCRSFYKNRIDGGCLLDMSINDFMNVDLTKDEAEIMVSALKSHGECED